MLDSPASANAAGSASSDSTGAGAPPSVPASAPGTPAVPATSQPAGGPPTSSSAPAAAPAPGGSPGQGPSRDASGRFVPGSKKSNLSPIPDLPGVFDSAPNVRDGDEAPDMSGASAAAAAAADGSTVTPPPPPPGAEGETPAAPPPQKFKFAGEEWDTQEKAEQSFSTLRGQFRSMQTRTQEAIGHANRAVDTAVAWQNYARELESRLQAGGPTAPQAGKPGASPSPHAAAGNEEAAGIDWQFYEELATNHGDLVARIWLQEQNDKIMEGRVSAAIEKAMGPVLPVIQEQQAKAQLVQLFGSIAGATLADGSQAYPELHDAAQAQAVMELLPHLGLTPEQAMTHKGVHLAIAVYRDQVRQAQKGQPAPTPPAVTPAAPAIPAPVPDASALAAAASAAAAVSSGVQPPVMQPAGPGGANGSVAAAIRNARDLRIDQGLGFSYE